MTLFAEAKNTHEHGEKTDKVEITNEPRPGFTINIILADCMNARVVFGEDEHDDMMKNIGGKRQ